MRIRKALLLLASVLLACGCSGALGRAGPAASPDGALDPALVDELWARTSAVRALPRRDDVSFRVVSSSQVAVLLRELVRAEWEPGELADYQEALVALGVWPEGRDLVEEYVALGADQFVGLYDPRASALYVIAGPPGARGESAPDTRVATVVHELVHALQHAAHPRLLEEDAAWKTQDDATMALRAAVEGDATFFGMETLLAGAELPDPAAFRDELERDFEDHLRSELASAPALLRRALPFPYVYGYRLAHAEREQLLEDPPASTEQVLHPERRRADFQVFDLAAAGRPPLPRGCEPLFENTLGEFGIAVLFDELDPDAAAGSALADGWDGDRYLAAVCEAGRELVWLTAWDSDDDARAFDAAYAALASAVAARGGLASPPRVSRRGREVLVATGGLAAWAAELPASVRRARVASFEALRAHFHGPGGAALPAAAHP